MNSSVFQLMADIIQEITVALEADFLEKQKKAPAIYLGNYRAPNTAELPAITIDRFSGQYETDNLAAKNSFFSKPVKKELTLFIAVDLIADKIKEYNGVKYYEGSDLANYFSERIRIYLQTQPVKGALFDHFIDTKNINNKHPIYGFGIFFDVKIQQSEKI